ncbi:neither inactivation nor afterpotential protein C [Contarinia nasturtii]|uniref:neither inactivation nor afterpotential protein C n=1 Tax=Contarinia nasturtii TaxID=265458 RepID=UPI0012D4742D|nr:neither inactivation nor afterpotential protein C [Contarinia nasturtii]XP_031623810.1 neither inactivation nor afterpotential protein C [Contarinia nasturtii]XP_031623811.1 neither inactivation nor afterpotential protein C [Contarinia nasturtii]
MMHLKVDSLPDPTNRFDLGEEIATGVWAKVYKAIDKESNGKTVAVKIQPYDDDKQHIIDDEYRILRDFSDHPNFLDFYGVYRKRVTSGGSDEIWFVLQYCDGGSAIDFIKRLHSVNRRLSEEHIAYILRETAKGLVKMHKHHFVHRDVRGSNILLTSEGEVKLADFGLSKSTGSTFGKRSTCIGSPSHMAPEMFGTPAKKNEELYSSRVDVWALGITAIEIGDGAAPFMDMHPTRAMFQIVRNPPPTLYRPANWSQNYNDFIAECLEKNPDNRPFLVELLEHPFFTELGGPTGNDHFLSCEIKHLLSQIDVLDKLPKEEISIIGGCIKRYNVDPEKMLVEDLCALDKLSEERISDLLKQRLERGDSYTFAGDVLISLNSNELPKEFPRSVHSKYSCKSRSDNAPHIFAVADSAYQDMSHHEEPQHILFAGESYAGKTTQLRHAVDHLCFLGNGNQNCSDRVRKSLDIVHALTNAGTPVNPDSTRCALQTQLTFGTTGKLSGVIYNVFLLEKLRVSSTDMDQSNFHIFYYFYDALSKLNELETVQLEAGQNYRYLRVRSEHLDCKLPYCRDDPEGNVTKFQEFEANLKLLDFEDEQIQSIRKILAAILILGNVRFTEDGKYATIETTEEVHKVASLLAVDEKKFEWALVNYCLVQGGMAEKRKQTKDEARDARDVLAATIYSRLVDWIISIINQKFAFGRAIFGDMHMISLNDMFGFECLPRNHIEQLMINSLNEQLQYHYNQRMFTWELNELEEENIPHSVYKFHNNKNTVDHLMSKPNGLFFFLDDATRDRFKYEFITDTIGTNKNSYVQRVSGHEFSVAHYTGKVTYDARSMGDKNRDFLPPDMMETLRISSDEIVKLLFLNPLSKTGNLTVAYNHQMPVSKEDSNKSKWGAALVAEKQKSKLKQKLNTLSHGQYSQVHNMRTLSTVFRSTSLEILKGLSIGGSSGNTHFVRCIRPTLDYKPRAYHNDMVFQQIRALQIHDTAIARQKGFPQRVCFQEFMRRYKFLAFEFDENVDMTKDNCRLLLIRLKMEGWAIGKTKVFLKYYNVEYLSRLYETQVKKIIKVQSMMRAFLAKRNVASKLKTFRQESIQKEAKVSDHHLSDADAALAIQKAYRGYRVRQTYGPLLNARTGKIDFETSKFIRPFAKRWKVKSIFQILLLYRSARYQDLVNLTQQIHLYNQAAVANIRQYNECMELEKVDPRESNPALLGTVRQPVRKLPFRLDEIPFYDTNYMCDPTTGQSLDLGDESDQEDWDAPLRRTVNISSHIINASSISPGHSANKYQRIIPGDEVSRHFSSPMRPAVYKSRATSPTPRNPIIRYEAPERSAINADLSAVKGKLNPVKELQLLARQNSANDENNEDAPPFNFQGMLRKTQHQRASMKRNKENGNDGDNSPTNGNIVYSSASSAKVNFDFDENDNIPPPVAPRVKAPVPSERKLCFGESTLLGGDDALHNIGTYVSEEIHPGIMLEGYAIEF